jgi:hypothetical protein
VGHIDCSCSHCARKRLSEIASTYFIACITVSEDVGIEDVKSVFLCTVPVIFSSILFLFFLLFSLLNLKPWSNIHIPFIPLDLVISGAQLPELILGILYDLHTRLEMGVGPIDGRWPDIVKPSELLRKSSSRSLGSSSLNTFWKAYLFALCYGLLYTVIFGQTRYPQYLTRLLISPISTHASRNPLLVPQRSAAQICGVMNTTNPRSSINGEMAERSKAPA